MINKTSALNAQSIVFKNTNFKNKVNNNPNSNCNNPINILNNNFSYPKNYYLNPVSFTGRMKKASDIINTIGEENFPSPKIFEKLKELGNSRDYSLYDIHLDYYKDLLDCKTLDEAKEKYPEFQDVIDTRDINISSLHKGRILYKISQGEIKEANFETLSLDILKKYYGRLNFTNNTKEYWGMSECAVRSMFDFLNIKTMDVVYARTAKVHSSESRENRSKIIKTLYDDPNSVYNTEEFKEKRTEALLRVMNTEEFKKNHLESVRSPETRRKIDEVNQKPETKANRSRSAKEISQRPEIIKKRKLNGKALSEAYNRHPEIRKMMQDVAKDYPRIGKILYKKRKDVQLTEEENGYYRMYCKACENTMPGYHKIICEEWRNVRIEWGLEKK